MRPNFHMNRFGDSSLAEIKTRTLVSKNKKQVFCLFLCVFEEAELREGYSWILSVSALKPPIRTASLRGKFRIS